MANDLTARVRDEIAEAIHDADCEREAYFDRDGECVHPAADAVLAVPLIAALLELAQYAHRLEVPPAWEDASDDSGELDAARAALDAVRRAL